MRARPAVRAVAWPLVAFWAAVILVFSVLPRPFGRGLVGDEIAHVLGYAVLAVLIRRALRRDGVAAARALAVVASVLYGGLVEGLQSFLPWRDAEWLDLAADGVGSLAAFMPIGVAADVRTAGGEGPRRRRSR